VLLEAMLAETPLISSNASGPAEVVRDTGWLFDLDSVDDLSKMISKIVSMPENDRRARSASALARVETEYSDKRFRKNLWGLKPMMELGQPERVSSS
jgi:glycosyltransferase involved in cell wall biosynthesis